MERKTFWINSRSFMGLILLPFFFIYLSCSSRHQAAQLQLVEDFLPDHLDSATFYLEQINPERLNEEHRAWFGLLQTIVDDMHFKDISSDSLIRPSYAYYHRIIASEMSPSHDAQHHYAQSCYYLAQHLELVDSLKESLSLLQEAVLHAEQIKDYRTAYLAYSSLSNQMRANNSHWGLDYAKKALDAYRLSNDNEDNYAIVLLNVAICYSLDHQPELATKYFEKAYQQTVTAHQIDMQRSVLFSKVTFYRMNNQMTEAIQCLRQAISISDSTDLDNYYFTMANCYLDADSLAEATEALSHVDVTQDDVTAYCVYLPLCKIAIRRHEASAAEQYLDSVQAKLEKIYYKQVAVKNDYYQDNIQKARQNEKLLSQSQIRAFIIVIVILLILVIFFIFIIHIRYERKKKALLLQQRKREIEANLQEHKLQEEKMKQAESALIILRKYVMEHAEIIRRLKDKEEIYSLTDSDWNDIEASLNSMYNNFAHRLRASYPQMKEEDLRFCLLVRLKLSNPSIGKIYSIGVSAVQKRKQRIKKDVFLINDPLITCEQFIEQF